MKQNAEKRRCIKNCNLNIGDVVLVKQEKRDKFTTPFSKTPLVVVNRNHDMITAKHPDGHTITRNWSHFKRVRLPSRAHVNPREVRNDDVIIDGQVPAHQQRRKSCRQARRPQRLIEE